MDFIEDKAAIEEMLRKGDWGMMATAAGGQAYAVPLNYAYVQGRIVFHGALEGRKLNEIAANPRVCFCVCRQTESIQDHGGNPCHVDSWSVLVFGRARVVTDEARKLELADAFNRAHFPEAKAMEAKRLKGCAIVEIEIEEMTARREVDEKRTYWRYRAS
jgi:hypothetical protein